MNVGFRTGVLDDPQRPRWDGEGPRPLAWTAWYPADDGGRDEAIFGGPPAAPWFALGTVSRDAPPRRGASPYPVVLLSHGAGGTALAMGWLGRRLARLGFVAVAVDHHGNTAAEAFRAEGFVCWWERARDLSVLLDLLPSDDALAGHIDPRQAFVVGFSLGGHTALALLGAVTEMERFRAWAETEGRPFARGPRNFPDLADHIPGLAERSAIFRESWARQSASYRDARIGAGLLLAPAPVVRAFGEASLAALSSSVRIFVGEADEDAPAKDGADWLALHIPGCAVGHLAGAGHAVFLPEPTEAGRRDAPSLCLDPPGVDRGAIHETIGKAAAALFRRP